MLVLIEKKTIFINNNNLCNIFTVIFILFLGILDTFFMLPTRIFDIDYIVNLKNKLVEEFIRLLEINDIAQKK